MLLVLLFSCRDLVWKMTLYNILLLARMFAMLFEDVIMMNAITKTKTSGEWRVGYLSREEMC